MTQKESPASYAGQR